MAKLSDYFSWADINKLKSSFDINKLKADPVGALFKIGGAYSALGGILGVADSYLFGGAGEDWVKENIYDYGTGDWNPETNQYTGGEKRKKGFLGRNWQTLRKYAVKPFSAGAEFARYINTEGYTYEDYRNKVFTGGADLTGPKREGESTQEYYTRQLLALQQEEKRLREQPQRKNANASHRDFSAYGRTPSGSAQFVAGGTAPAKFGGFRDGGIGQAFASQFASPRTLENVMAAMSNRITTQGQNIRLQQSGINVKRA